MAGNKTIGTLLFRIESDTKALRKGMSQTKQSINSLKKSFNTIAVAAAAAFSVRAVTSFTKEIVNLAGEADGVKDAFDRIAAPGLLDDLQNATKNTVTNLDLMKRAVMAHNFQIPLEQLASLFAFATKRAQQTGESVDFLVNSIVIGIGRKSPLILDNLGISAVRLREELNNAGHSGATVFQVAEAVGKIAQKEMSEAGDIINTTKVATEQLAAAWGNVKLQLGQVVDEHFNLATNIGKVSAALEKFDPEDNEFLKTIKEINELIIKLNPALWSTVLALSAVRKAQQGGDKETANQVSADNFWEIARVQQIKLARAARAAAEALRASAAAARAAAEARRPPARVTSIGAGGGTPVRQTGAATSSLLPGNILQITDKRVKESLVRITGELRKSNLVIKEAKGEFLELGLVVQQAFLGAVDAFGGFIESLAAGDMQNAFNEILRLFGGFVVQMGKMIAAYGISMLAFQNAFARPEVAIAAGIALVAIGSAIVGLASRGPSVSGVAVSSSTAGGGFTAVRGTSVLRGSDIWLAGQRGAVSIGGVT